MASGSSGQDFQRLCQAATNNIQKISNNVNQLQSIQTKMSAQPGDLQLKDKFHQLQHYTNQLAKDTNQYMKNLNSYPPQGSASDQRMQKMQQERLVAEFTKVLNVFQGLQREEKAIEGRQRMTRLSGEFGNESSFTNQDSFKPANKEQVMVQIDASDVDMEIVREREEALAKLESDITDVNQIFRDLGMMVHQQGEVIDTIEDNVVSAASQVESGTEQLRKARDHQTRARKTKCIIISIILIVLIIIIIILATTLSKKAFLYNQDLNP